MPARSLGSRSSCIRRSAATSSVTSWRRWSPEAWASASSCSMPMRSSASTSWSSSATSRYAPPRSPRSSCSSRSSRSWSSRSRSPCTCSPSGVRHPRLSMRCSASCRSPLASRSSVSCGQDRVGVVDERVLGAVPAAGSRSARSSATPVVARAPAASLLRRLVRCSPSSRNSTALATTPGVLGTPVRASTGADRAGIWARVVA